MFSPAGVNAIVTFRAGESSPNRAGDKTVYDMFQWRDTDEMFEKLFGSPWDTEDEKEDKPQKGRTYTFNRVYMSEEEKKKLDDIARAWDKKWGLVR